MTRTALTRAQVVDLRIAMAQWLREDTGESEQVFAERWQAAHAPHASVWSILSAAHGRTWASLPGAIPAAPHGVHGPRRYGVRRDLRKLTESQVRTIRRLHKEGQPVNSLAQEFGLARSHVDRIVNRVIWRDLEE